MIHHSVQTLLFGVDQNKVFFGADSGMESVIHGSGGILWQFIPWCADQII